MSLSLNIEDWLLTMAPGPALTSLIAQLCALQVRAAALPCRARKHGRDRVLEAVVGVGDDELDPGKPTRLEVTQEGQPPSAVF